MFQGVCHVRLRKAVGECAGTLCHPSRIAAVGASAKNPRDVFNINDRREVNIDS
jgi:hypothetical protein